MLDLKKYSELKEKSLISLVKAGDSYATATQKFNPEDGTELPDEVVGVNMEELLKKKEELQAEIAEIDAFIADCNKLDVVEIVK